MRCRRRYTCDLSCVYVQVVSDADWRAFCALHPKLYESLEGAVGSDQNLFGHFAASVPLREWLRRPLFYAEYVQYLQSEFGPLRLDECARVRATPPLSSSLDV